MILKYGIYIIKDVLPEKDKWKHTLYKGICKECGYERVGTINDFKKKITQCKHISSLSKEQFEEWFSKNKRVCLNCNKYIPFNKKESVSNYKKDFFATIAVLHLIIIN